MPRCTRCGRKGFFLKLKDGLCDNCASTVQMEQEQTALKAQIEEMSVKLRDQTALFDKISEEARANGVAKAASAKS